MTKLAASLQTSTSTIDFPAKCEVHDVIRLLQGKGLRAANIHRRMTRLPKLNDMDADDMQGYGRDMLLLEPHVALKVNITQTIAQIQPDLCGRVVENWTTQICATVRSRGGHLNDVIFHT
ncbi:hypothetical protein ABEB36_009324 [Hypothenemus hampei]|uniref:Uncharacterized protein n=1 Tax=Hypothenemus hampei TaxID=57062 RepID=A0ABD1EGD1_HYPHA